MKIIRTLNEICTGCEMCLLNCSLAKTGIVNPWLARMRLTHTEEGGSHPVICQHCEDAPCLEACPVPGAMELDAKTGAIVVNDENCIACLDCVAACPFDAIQVGPNNEVLKCDLCEGEPVCVKYCPTRPENSLPHLSFPERSCLEFVEREGAQEAS